MFGSSTVTVGILKPFFQSVHYHFKSVHYLTKEIPFCRCVKQQSFSVILNVIYKMKICSRNIHITKKLVFFSMFNDVAFLRCYEFSLFLLRKYLLKPYINKTAWLAGSNSLPHENNADKSSLYVEMPLFITTH